MEKESINELLSALVTASEEQKQQALRLLRGETTQAPKVEPFITLREAGRMLGISVVSLWRWRVPGYELAGRRRVRISEVLAYLESPAFRKRADELREERRNKSMNIC